MIIVAGLPITSAHIIYMFPMPENLEHPLASMLCNDAFPEDDVKLVMSCDGTGTCQGILIFRAPSLFACVCVRVWVCPTLDQHETEEIVLPKVPSMA